MGRKKIIKSHAGTGHTCGECMLGIWNEDNFDYQGKPFLIYCIYATYAYNKRAGMPVSMSHHDACPNFVQGERK